ncbi:UNVERIFIED_CONTAM: hypothetical protein FKN15_047592 [Acipenser sinensis]
MMGNVVLSGPCRPAVLPPQSYSVGGQHSSGQLTGKPAGARPDYGGRWCARNASKETKKSFFVRCCSSPFIMAEASSLIHENQVTCSICLDIFTSPVSTPCGHSYCKNCIENHWDSGVYTCPLCKDEFHSRPNLNINRSLAEIAEQFRNSSIEEYDAQPGDVLCSFCLGRKLKAVKSCLQCLASYCEKHIKPHCEKPPFKRHTLLDPVEDFEGKVCNLHQQLLDIYCRTDQKLICHFCIDEEHKGHDLVTAKSERKEKQNMMEETQRRIKTRLQESREKLSSLNVVVGKVDDRAQREIEASNKIFDELINSTERIRAELLGKIRGEQNAARRPAEGPIQQLEQEIAALEWRNNVLEQLKQSEDHIHFLQVNNEHLFSVKSKVELNEHGGGGQTKAKKFHGARCYRFISSTVDLTLDPHTRAHSQLILSRTKVVHHPGHADVHYSSSCVEGREAFTSGRHYWEVKVKHSRNWILGVTSKSAPKKWVFDINNYCGFWSCYREHVRWGVFVDFKEGFVSFYNVKTRSNIHTITGTFTDTLYPLFCTVEDLEIVSPDET